MMTVTEEALKNLDDEIMTADTRSTAPFRLFAQIVNVDRWECVLESGAGKVPYDSFRHAPYRKRIALTIEAARLSDKRLYKKEWLIGDNRDDKGWVKITLPSLRVINAHLSTLNGKYVAIDFTPTGKKYMTKATDDKPAEERSETTWSFVELFNTHDECEAAELMHTGGYKDESEPNVVETSTAGPWDVNKVAPSSVPANDKSLAIQAAKALWMAAKHNEAEFRKYLKTNSNVLSGFDKADESGNVDSEKSIAAALAAVKAE
jgi:hypothetical protein